MEIIKNNEIESNLIKQLRKQIVSDNADVKRFLGINSSNITTELPLKNRNFHIWIFLSMAEIIGYVSFDDQNEDIKFIKALYVLPKHRNKGYGRQIIHELYQQHPKLECKINSQNNAMYRILKYAKMKGEKSGVSLMLSKEFQPVWWSNHKSNDSYV
jgi:GNAT superfamily N-acetyltransferase